METIKLLPHIPRDWDDICNGDTIIFARNPGAVGVIFTCWKFEHFSWDRFREVFRESHRFKPITKKYMKNYYSILSSIDKNLQCYPQGDGLTLYMTPGPVISDLSATYDAYINYLTRKPEYDIIVLDHISLI